jgi:acyl-CoA dehydrogenase
MSWDFSTDLEFQAKLDWMLAFVREKVFPLETLELTADQWARAAAPLKAEVKRQGLWAAHLPPTLGGMGLGLIQLGLMYEIIGQSFLAAEVFGNPAPDSGTAVMMAPVVTEEQREKYLTPLLAGDLRCAFSMTEPNTSGSDPTLISTTAIRDGDDYVVNGIKWFTSNGSMADFIVVMAVTDTSADADPRKKCSMIIVPTSTEGVNVTRDIPNMADPSGEWRHGRHVHSEIIYKNVRVPVGNLLGKEGDGFKLAQSRLGPARVHRCMEWVGTCHRAFDMMCEYSKSRFTAGSTLANKQTVQSFIADSAAEIEAARLMVLKTAWKVEREGDRAARKEIAMIKFYVANVLCNVVDRAVQVHGALGYSGDLPLEDMYRHARNARIVDGPDEVHRVTVARLVVADYTARAVPTEHIPTRRAAAEKTYVEILATGEKYDGTFKRPAKY